MRLTVIGAGPACPNPGGASSGYLLDAGEGPILIDCGHGVASKLQTMVDVGDIKSVLISHMHPDHFLDLIPLKYCLQFNNVPRLPVYLPPGGLSMLKGLRPALDLPDTFFEESYHLEEYDPEQQLRLGSLDVIFAATEHFIPAWAMRFQRDDVALLYGADTAPDESVAKLGARANLAVLEATLLEQRWAVQGHLTGAEAGDLAERAGARRLLLTHYWEPRSSEILDQAAATFSGPVELARSGVTYSVG
ncbi:MAG: MBL fold metallo-hydrolase [Chloroflexota bacterium]